MVHGRDKALYALSVVFTLTEHTLCTGALYVDKHGRKLFAAMNPASTVSHGQLDHKVQHKPSDKGWTLDLMQQLDGQPLVTHRDCELVYWCVL